jgi:hypothetical protein
MGWSRSGAEALTIPRVFLKVPTEAAEACGVSVDYFDKHIRPELKLIRRGRFTFVTVKELERWAEANSSRATRDRA